MVEVTGDAPIEPVVEPPLAPQFGRRWRIAFALSVAGLGLLVWGIVAPSAIGIGVWGNDIPYVWGFDLANYAWWVGIANGASLFASLLVLRRHNLRTAANRFAEGAALATVTAAAVYPLFHIGKPWFAYWMFPYPATTGLWPQFVSVLTWDFWAILAHFLVTGLFWYVGLIPDLAVLRDKADTLRTKRVYGALALGWRGSARQWAYQQHAHRLVALAVIPMIFVMQSAVAFEFTATMVPGWHDTRLPLHMAVSGFATGIAATLLLAHALREGLGLQRHIDRGDVELLAKLALASALAGALFWVGELALALLGPARPWEAMAYRLFGPQGWIYWAGIVLALGVPHLLWSARLRRSAGASIAVAAAVLLGVWFDRVSLLAAPLARDRLLDVDPVYAPTLSEWVLFAGTFALVAFWLLLFARTLPIVSLYETAHDEHEEATA